MNPGHVPEKLRTFFSEHPRVALAFSGGTDSTYLLYAAVDSGAEVAAYLCDSQFQPRWAAADAERTAAQLGLRVRTIKVDILAVPGIRENTAGRCYLCKKKMLGLICRAAADDGYGTVIDGTNASDSEDERPGTKALREMHILSPLRDAGITKAMVRELSRGAGLHTWNMPSYSCLATRCEENIPITEALLRRTEACENMVSDLGFSDFRVRTRGSGAVLEIRSEQEELLRERRADVERILLEQYDSLAYSERCGS